MFDIIVVVITSFVAFTSSSMSSDPFMAAASTY